MAIQSLLKAGFFSAVQVELVFIIGGLHTVTKATRFRSFRNFVPKRDFDPCYRRKTGKGSRTEVMARRSVRLRDSTELVEVRNQRIVLVLELSR